ncbi:hypothetical protein FSP39_002191 [Pinctada imbricata]|uniref:Endonuclease n=1 Tax=Pinctada imbricata TaxID=66713 RepID=A0AA89C076_PINIB|nr:hypothetical protein FSP39_002191 [Pinctada imbricata]
MVFSVTEFLKSPTVDEFESLKKDDLIGLGLHLKLDVKSSMRKQEIRNIVAKELLAEEIFSSYDFPVEPVSSETKMSKYEFELEKMKIQLQFEKEEKERQFEREKQERMHEKELQFELEKLKLEKGAKENPVPSPVKSEFDAAKNIRLVPKFQEKSVDKYFPHFEKIAANLKWPRDFWPTLLQSVLIGKAAEVYSALSIAESSDYDKVKDTILRAYQLVPEAYRQKFRKYKKFENQTYVEFAREKEDLFDNWFRSKKIPNSFDNLRQIILIEEFKECVHQDLRTHLEDKNVKTLEEAAVSSDTYALTHKKNFVSKTQSSDSAKTSDFPKKNLQESQSSISSQSPSEGGSTSGPRFERSEASPGVGSPPTCNYCKKKGHVIGECLKLKKKKELKSQACASVRNDRKALDSICSDTPEIQGSKSSSDDFVEDHYKPFLSQGFVSLSDSSEALPVQILRDTGAAQTLLLEGSLPLSEHTFTGRSVLLQGVELGVIDVPLHKIYLKSDLITGPVIVGVRPTLPVQGVSLLLGNDLAGGKVVADPIVCEKITSDVVSDDEDDDLYPACAVTRAMARNRLKEAESTSALNEDHPSKSIDLSDTFMSTIDDNVPETSVPLHVDKSPTVPGDDYHPPLDRDTDALSREQLLSEQTKDPEIIRLSKRALPREEADKVGECFYIQDGILMRKWRPPDAPPNEVWRVVHQIVVPVAYRGDIMSLAHDTPMAGHLGVNKTYNRILSHFYWPKLRKDVSEFCKSCHSCQMVGKPNQVIPPAPLQPIPAFEEPFSRVLVDCVGPLPRTRSGNQYLLTIMCTSTRFPEAIPLRNIKAKTIVKALTKFFSFVGAPKAIQSDQGSNFMSGLFQQVMHELGIRQYKSSAYHPESQGALERFHQTLKTMMKTYCHQYGKDWDEGVHLVLFAAREAVQESLGFSPFELVFGHTVRGPLKLLKEKWLTETSNLNLLDYVSNFKEKLYNACKLAQENLKTSQMKMKTWYDKDARNRVFKPGDKVLVFLPIPGHPLQARYFGPYEIESKISDVNYVVKTPGRRKEKRVCHVNMLKEYFDRSDRNFVKPVSTLANVNTFENCIEPECNEETVEKDFAQSVRLKNSEILTNPEVKLGHLTVHQKEEVHQLMREYTTIFPDVPKKTNASHRDVIVGDASPIKQHPYRLNPIKLQYMRKEIQYMLENDIIEPSNSDWSSPCILVPKPDGTYRLCTDFRKVNSVTETDSYPIPRIDDCIDKIGSAKFVSKFDLLKGYWQVPLTERAREISAFATPDGLYQYKVMPFGMKNAPATFQRMIHSLLNHLEGCEAYIDDVIIYSDTWDDHLRIMRTFFDILAKANLTVNLAKSEFCHATVEYLGHKVGQGFVTPIMAKVEAISKFPIPTNKKEIMRFLGMAGFYRKFCPNFSSVVGPLTNQLQKKVNFAWTNDCEESFKKIKCVLMNSPVLSAPNFDKQFKLTVDASDVGIGAALFQENDDGVDRVLQLFKGSWDVITSLDVGRKTLPKFSMHSEEDHGNSTLLFDVQLVSPSVLNFTLSRQKKGSPAIRLITWSIATAESTSLFHVVDWNPAVTRPVVGIMTGLKVKLGQKFIKAGEETLKNLHRDYSDYVIIFLDKSPKMILKQYVMPILVRVPPAKYIAKRFLLHGKSSSLPANVPSTKVKQAIHGNVLWYVCTKLQSAVLKGIGEVLINPPSLFPPFMKNVVEPALKKAIRDSQISYTTPLPFKLKNFMSFPQRTIGEKYLENVLRRLIFDKKTKRPPFTAWIYRRQFIQTFDNKAFKIPETSVECTHVLTADGKEGKFALVMSQQELTLLTLTRPVTIDTQGRVFIEDCNNPRIPVLGSNITGEGVNVTRQNNGWIKVTTSYGIDVACSPVRELCKVSVSTHLLNRTFGLLGVTDYEEGTDFRIRNGRIVLDASEFVSDYRILSQSCQSIKPTYTVDEGCSDVCKEVFELKYVSTRNCASKDIFVKACLMSDCKSTQDDRCEEMKTFMSTCSSMSSRYMLSRVYQRAGCSGDWREPTQPLPVTTIPADIILVISSFSNGNDSLVALLDIMAELSSMTDDIRVGILHYGQSTKPQNKQTSSLFLDIRNVSAKTVGQIWREDPAILSEVEAVKAAMNYPLRLHSTKQVILLTPQQVCYLTDLLYVYKLWV